MSTKAIRELADLACARWPEAAEKALAEVEAIEAAAKDVTEALELRAVGGVSGAAETLESIAKDAP